MTSSMPSERVVYEVERDSGGLMFSAPLQVGEYVRVVPEAREVELAEALRAVLDTQQALSALKGTGASLAAWKAAETAAVAADVHARDLVAGSPRSHEVVPLGTKEALREVLETAPTHIMDTLPGRWSTSTWPRGTRAFEDAIARVTHLTEKARPLVEGVEPDRHSDSALEAADSHISEGDAS